MKIAFASSDGVAVNRHFGLAEAYYLWELDRHAASCVGSVTVDEGEGDQEGKILARARMLEGCTLVYSMQIGGPAAAKLVARHIQPLKTTTEVPILDLVEKLKVALQGRPPPWLAKALGEPVERSFSPAEDE
jgi:nitrogen fixation protein NifX